MYRVCHHVAAHLHTKIQDSGDSACQGLTVFLRRGIPQHEVDIFMCGLYYHFNNLRFKQTRMCHILSFEPMEVQPPMCCTAMY